MSGRTAIFFVAEGDHLTAQAILLAASLRFHNGPTPELIAYVPNGADPIPEPAQEAFAFLSTDLCPLAAAPGQWKRPYPHGNKMLACAAPRDAARHVFMDSDMVCVAPMDFESIITPDAVSLVPEGTPTWGKNDDRWNRVYDFFGLPMPTDRVRLTRRKRIEFLPYFNAGMVAFHNETQHNGRGFADLWLDTARIIDHDISVGAKRPWLDQIALPVTLKRFGISYRALPDVWNFSISDRAFEADVAPKLIHYHSFRYGPIWPQFRQELVRMVEHLGPARMAALTPLYGQHWFRATEAAR